MIPLRRQRLSRRHLLRASVAGVGTAISLPALEAMFATDNAYAQDANGLPRFLAVYQPNGHHRDKYHPKGGGRNLDFSGQAAAPLEPMMEHMTLLQNLAGCHTGASGNGHLTGIVSWLTGAQVPDDKATTHKVSLDTHIGEYYEKEAPTGRPQHLVLSGSPFVDPGRMAYNNEQKDWLSTARNGEKIPGQIDIEGVFNRIMMDVGEPTDPVDTSVMEARLALRKSALDYVDTGIQQLDTRLGMADRAAVDNYLTSIREIEDRLSMGVGGSPTPMCDDGPLSFKRKWPSQRKADQTNDYIDEHWQDTMRVLKVAFQCEAVRSVAYMLETEAGESGYRNHGLPNSHGAAHSTNDAYSKRDKLHSDLIVEMLNVFKDTPVGAGSTLLDQTMILFGMGQGINHSADKTTAILAGYTGSGKHLPKINHGAMQNLNNDMNMSAVIRTIGLHLEAIGASEGFGDAGANDQIDLSV